MTARNLLDMINRDFAYEVAHATTPILLKLVKRLNPYKDDDLSGVLFDMARHYAKRPDDLRWGDR